MLALCAAAPFAGDKVTTRTTDNAKFSAGKTYQWLKTNQEIANPITNENVIGWINSELSGKGWAKSDTGSCFVSNQVAVQQQRGASWSGMGERWMFEEFPGQ